MRHSDTYVTVADVLAYIAEHDIPLGYRVGIRAEEGAVDYYAVSLDRWGGPGTGCLEITDEPR